MPTDPKMNAFRAVQKLDPTVRLALADGDLKRIRTACTALLHLEEHERSNVWRAVEAMRGGGE